MTKFFDMK